MDYITNPTNRQEVRELSIQFRKMFGYRLYDKMDPIELLDRLQDNDMFKNVVYEIVDDSKLPSSIPTTCEKEDSFYVIKIKESIYNGALYRKIGGYRMHVMHEIMHVYADKLGFIPIRPINKNEECPPYCSLEWIVKAMAGEVMIPFFASKHMDVCQIMNEFGVSEAAARMRVALTY